MLSKTAAFVDDTAGARWNLQWRKNENSEIHNAGLFQQSQIALWVPGNGNAWDQIRISLDGPLMKGFTALVLTFKALNVYISELPVIQSSAYPSLYP